MEKKSIGSFLASLRKEHGMTQKELADILNVSNKTVSKWERDESYPEITLIPIIADLFNVTADELLRGERISHDNIKIQDYDVNNRKIILNINSDNHLKRLLDTNLAKYKTIAYIAIALTMMGLIALFTISYTFYRPVLAFGVFMVFVVASILLMAININNVNSYIKDEMLTDKVKITDPAIKQRNKYAYACFYGNTAAFVMAVPFLLFQDSKWLYSVIGVKSYVSLLSAMLPAMIVILWFVYKLIKCRSIFSREHTHKKLRQMNIIHAVAAVSCYILLILNMSKIIDSKFMKSGWFVLIYLFPLAFIVVSSIVYVITGKGWHGRLLIGLAGLRNYLLGYTALKIIVYVMGENIAFSLADATFSLYLRGKRLIYDGKFIYHAYDYFSKFREIVICMWGIVIIISLYELCRISYLKKQAAEHAE